MTKEEMDAVLDLVEKSRDMANYNDLSGDARAELLAAISVVEGFVRRDDDLDSGIVGPYDCDE